MFLFTKKITHYFSPEEKERIVDAIRNTEKVTSGEIRVMIESNCNYVDAIDKAAELFFNLEMDETEERNGVLVYVAVKDKQFAIFGDENIYKKAGTDFWNQEVGRMLFHFKDNHVTDAIVQCIFDIGELLKFHFPYNGALDKNELPDEIIFGK